MERGGYIQEKRSRNEILRSVLDLKVKHNCQGRPCVPAVQTEGSLVNMVVAGHHNSTFEGIRHALYITHGELLNVSAEECAISNRTLRKLEIQ